MNEDDRRRIHGRVHSEWEYVPTPQTSRRTWNRAALGITGLWSVVFLALACAQCTHWSGL